MEIRRTSTAEKNVLQCREHRRSDGLRLSAGWGGAKVLFIPPLHTAYLAFGLVCVQQLRMEKAYSVNGVQTKQALSWTGND